MSLTLTRPFTISTYDPPSTPIGLAAQYTGTSRGNEQRIGAHPANRQGGTPPRQDSDSTTGPPGPFATELKGQETPSAKAKILPWVQGVTAPETDPEGMVGPYPYDSPPSRLPTLISSGAPTPQRNVHPFAYTGKNTVPFSALADHVEPSGDRQSRRVPDSDIQSRGVVPPGRDIDQQRDPSRNAAKGGLGGHSPQTEESQGMGSFGVDRRALQNPMASSEALPLTAPKATSKAASKTSRKPAPAYPAPNSHKAPSRGGSAKPQPVSDDDEYEKSYKPHLHHPHHEFPFSKEEAAEKQAEAMAHIQTLAQLTNRQADYAGGEPTPTGRESGMRGPHRMTYETVTSVPSFGHLYHRDGMPISRHLSMQPDPAFIPGHGPIVTGQGNVSRELAGLSASDFFRLPFGPMVQLHRPFPSPQSPDDLPLGMGIGGILAEALRSDHPEDRFHVAESPDSVQRRDARSAFVESVEDEEAPDAAPSRSMAQSRAGRSTHTHVDRSAAASRADARTARTAASPDLPYTPERQGRQSARNASEPAPSNTPSLVHTSGGTNARRQQPDANRPPAPGSALFGQSGAQPNHLRPSVQLGTAVDSRLASQTSNMPTQGTMTPRPIDDLVAAVDEKRAGSPSDFSTSLTTASNIQQIVANSAHHDEVLCQLLDAARLNLIGAEAKKALNRAAKARVIELRDMRARGELPENAHISLSRHSHKKKRERGRTGERHRRRPSDSPDSAPDETSPSTPPQWAQEIMKRLASFDARFANMEQQKQDGHTSHPHHHDRMATDQTAQTMAQTMDSALIDDLLFGDQFVAQLGFPPGGIPGFPPFGFGPFGNQRDSVDSQEGGFIRTLSPSEEQRRDTRDMKRDTNGDMTWGSEVELPQPSDKVSPPRTNFGPIINIQAPTESNMDKTTQRPLTPSQAGSKTPTVRHIEIDILEQQVLPDGHGAMPDPRERDLPPPPSESIRSNLPSPAGGFPPLPLSAATTGTARTARSVGRGETPLDLQEALNAGPTGVPSVLPPSQRPMSRTTYSYFPPVQPLAPQIPPVDVVAPHQVRGSSDVPDSQAHTAYKTAYQSMPGTPKKSTNFGFADGTKKGSPQNQHDKATSMPADPTAWELVTQRLYSWALIQEDSSFTNAMEDLSLNRQVGEIPLSIFVMMTYKRMIRRSLTEVPHRPCDKLFVPPNIADSINRAVHAQNYGQAAQMLEELWYPFLFKDPPRVIIALARHRNEDDHWTAHRFDLTNGHMRSYTVTHESECLPDGRTFRWWDAIKIAWPQYNIPAQDDRVQRTEKIQTIVENRHNNSLEALNHARNLFLGFRPEHPADLAKLRENLWAETKRLLHKKRTGSLVVEMDSTSPSQTRRGSQGVV